MFTDAEKDYFERKFQNLKMMVNDLSKIPEAIMGQSKDMVYVL